jgi:DNA-binding response OmpR family regulator
MHCNEDMALRLLLIEDDTKSASCAIKVLTQNGYTVDHATDGEMELGAVLMACAP